MRVRFCIVYLLAACTVSTAQIESGEIVGISSAGGGHWDNIIVAQSGVQHVITFDFSATLPTGMYGVPRLTGSYAVQGFQSRANKIVLTTGVPSSTLPPGGNPCSPSGPSPSARYARKIAPTDPGTRRSGILISHINGLPIDLVSIEYRNQEADLETVAFAAGAGFTDTPSFLAMATTHGIAQGVFLNDPTWNTFPPVFEDLGIVSIDAPVTQAVTDCIPLGVTETVSMTIKSSGVNPIAAGTTIQVAYALNGGPPISQPITLPAMNRGDTLPVIFGTAADLSMPGDHTVAVTLAYGPDQNPLNDASSTVVHSSGGTLVTTFPFIETFDSSFPHSFNSPATPGKGSRTSSGQPGTTVPPADWIQDPNDTSGTDWDFRSTPSPINTPGPSADHTTGVPGVGYYAHMEDDNSIGFGTLNLLTPCLDLTALTNPWLQFWVYSHFVSTTGQTTSCLSVDVITFPGATVFTDVQGAPISDLGDDDWHVVNIDLSAFIRGPSRIRFRAAKRAAYHDIAIDDVKVYELVPGIGQAPQPGLAVMDVNMAHNANVFPVSSGHNGAYFVSVTAGGPAAMTFSGEPGQPIVLLSGPLNEANKTFPGQGQLDIGTCAGGLVGNVDIVASGTGGTVLETLLFKLGATGTQSLTFTIPPALAGTVFAFQSAIFNSASVVGLSNAVELTIL